MSKFKLLLIALVFLSIIGCKGDKNNPTFKALVNLQLSDLTKKKIELKGNLIFTNPSSESITYKKTVADINLDGVDLNTYYHKKTITVKGNKEFSIPIYMSIEPKDIKNKDSKKVTVKISGEVEFETEKGKVKKIKFSDSQTINVEVFKAKAKETKESELSEREIKKLEKKLRKGKIDSTEFEVKMK